MLFRSFIVVLLGHLSIPHLATAAGAAGGGPRIVIPDRQVYISRAEWLRMENRLKAFGQATIMLPDQELVVEEVSGQVQTVEDVPRVVLWHEE